MSIRSLSAVLGLTAMLAPMGALPAMAQYPPPAVVVDTPRNRIVVSGDDWSPGTTVEYCVRPATAPSEGCPDGSETTTFGAKSGQSFVASAPVASDGSVSTTIDLPEGLNARDIVVVARGIDSTGDAEAVAVQASLIDGIPTSLVLDAEPGFAFTRGHALGLAALAAMALAGAARRRRVIAE